MRHFFIVFAIICSLSSLFAAQLSIANYNVTTNNIVVTAGDVLAPITAPAFHLLGYNLDVKNDKITITNNSDSKQVMTLTIDSVSAAINGKATTLSTAPTKKNNELLLPMKALADFMNVNFIQNTQKQLYQLMPIVKAVHSTYNGKDIITITSTVTIDHKYGVLTGPHRVYVDSFGTFVPTDTTNIMGHSITGIRLNQFSADPPTSRIVFDCKEECTPYFRFEDNKRKLIITLEPKVKTIFQDFTFQIDEMTGTTTFNVVSNKIITPNMTRNNDRLIIPLPGILTVEDINKVTKLKSAQIRSIRTINNNSALELTLNPGTDHAVLNAEEATIFSLVVLQGASSAASIQMMTTPPKPLPKEISKTVVVIDAGHGGGDSGAIGQNRTFEKNINLDVAKRAAELLRASGVTVLMTRDTDVALVLANRPVLGNSSGADLFVSIHCNSCATPNTANGTETYYYRPYSADFARIMQENLVAQLRLQDRKHKSANYLVIRESVMPSVLVELAYINHREEEALLNDPDFRQRAAQGIHNGIIAYLKANGAK